MEIIKTFLFLIQIFLHILDKQIIVLNINNKGSREETMKNKKILILFIISVILIVVIGYFAIKIVKQKKSNEISDEYVPQEEISDEQSRETIVSHILQIRKQDF